MANTNLPGNDSSKTKVKLPEGLTLQIIQQAKIFRWNHTSTIGGGDPTLNGLLRVSPKQNPQVEHYASLTHPVGIVTEDRAKQISQNYYVLDDALRKSGIQVLDDKANAFIDKASRMKQQLAKKYGSNEISTDDMKRADALVNQEAFNCFELVLKGFSVTRDNPKGSKQRKSDGMFILQRVLRRVYINRQLTDAELQSIMKFLLGEVVRNISRTTAFRIEDKGIDPNGYRHFDLKLANPAAQTTNRNRGSGRPGKQP